MSYFVNSLAGFDFKINMRCKCIPMEDDLVDGGLSAGGSAIGGGRSVGRASQSIRKGKWPEGSTDISEFGEFILKPEFKSPESPNNSAENLPAEDINDWTLVLKENVFYILQDEFDLEPMYAFDVSQYLLYTSATMTERLSFKLAHSTSVSYFLKAQTREDFQKCLHHLSLIVDDFVHLS